MISTADLGLIVGHRVFYKYSSTTEANESRLFTKVRWTVEVYHSRMKKWRILPYWVVNPFLPEFGDMIKIISAVLNAFRGSIMVNAQNDDLHVIAKLM